MLVRFLRERQQRLFAARHERLSSCACRTRPRNFVLHLTHFGEMRREPYSCQGSVHSIRYLLFALALLLVSQSASAIVTVGPAGSGCQFTKIQDAIDAVHRSRARRAR